MYPEIDEGMMSCLSNPQNTKPIPALNNQTAAEILGDFEVFYYRDLEDPTVKTTKSINIAHAGDVLRPDGKMFDGSPRAEDYVLLIIVPGLTYIETMKAMRDVIQAIKTELETNSTFALWSQWMELGDVRPAYDERGVYKEQQMQLIFNVDEDYFEDDENVAEIKIRGEIID